MGRSSSWVHHFHVAVLRCTRWTASRSSALLPWNASCRRPCHVYSTIYESWVVPAGVPSALADIGGELRQIIDCVKERGVTKSIPEGGG